MTCEKSFVLELTRGREATLLVVDEIRASPMTFRRHRYSTYAGPGQIALTDEDDPQLRFMGDVTVQNSIAGGANGSWQITSLAYDLSTRPDALFVLASPGKYLSAPVLPQPQHV